MCRIGARGWAGFLQHKIPGKSAGGPGLPVSPRSPGWGSPVGTALAWGAAAAPPTPLWEPGDLGCAHAVSAGGWQCPVPVWAAWADPGLEHCSMGWVRSCGVGEEPWDGRGAAPAVFAEPTLCPSLRVVESSANMAEPCVTSAGGGCWSLGFCHPPLQPGAHCSGVHGAGAVCPGVGLASFWPGVTVLLLLRGGWSWDPGKY